MVPFKKFCNLIGHESGGDQYDKNHYITLKQASSDV